MLLCFGTPCLQTTDRFLRLSVELAIERCLESLDAPQQVAAKVQYLQVDALAQLVAVLLRYFDEWKQTTSMSKLTLFNKVLGVIVKQMHADHGERKTNFNQKPYHRLLLRLLLDTSDVLGDQTQLAMADALLALQPRMVPGFAFAWLELASHKAFMPRLLQDKEKGSVLFSRILLVLFKYLEPFLRNAELQEPIKMLYMGTLRVLLVLLHDFPEILCEFHVSLCDAIPPSCIQLRNLILSAFPKEMVLPDPFTFQERLPPLEGNKAPVMSASYTAALNSANIRGDLDAFLHGRGSRTLLQDLQGQLRRASGNVCGLHFIGHGAEGGLYLVSEDGRRPARIEASSLVQMIEAAQSLQVCLLNACDTESLGLELKRGGLKHVVCWRGPVADAVAHRFSQEFYQTLNEEPGQYRKAFCQGKLAAKALQDDRWDAGFQRPLGSPCYFCASPDAGAQGDILPEPACPSAPVRRASSDCAEDDVEEEPDAPEVGNDEPPEAPSGGGIRWKSTRGVRSPSRPRQSTCPGSLSTLKSHAKTRD